MFENSLSSLGGPITCHDWSNDAANWNAGAYEGMKMQERFDNKILNGNDNILSLGDDFENEILKSSNDGFREAIIFQNMICTI